MKRLKTTKCKNLMDMKKLFGSFRWFGLAPFLSTYSVVMGAQ